MSEDEEFEMDEVLDFPGYEDNEIYDDVNTTLTSDSDGFIGGTDSDEPKSNIVKDLFLFYITFRLSKSGMLYLLHILKMHGLDVPTSMHLFKKRGRDTPVDIKQFINPEKSLAYFSIKDNIRHCISKGLCTLNKQLNELSVQFSVDGVQLFHSSPVSLWPILMSIRNSLFKPLPIACYVGVGKPSLNGFLKEFSDELRAFRSCENVDGQRITFSNVSFVCDAPAKAFLQFSKSHSGYNSCCFCRIKGEYYGKKVIFPYSSHFARRNDDTYLDVEENNQKGPSPLLGIVSFVTGFPVDFMHCVCLGVYKRFLYSIMTTDFGVLSCKFSQSQKLEMDNKYAVMKKQLPSDFQRRCRSLRYLSHFKATEYRASLLYIAPVLFNGILKKEYYDHLMMLHFGVYVFASDDLIGLREAAHASLQRYVFDLARLFGKESLTFNSHNLLHLKECVDVHGPLDGFSAFKFESYLSCIKARITSGNFVLQQTSSSLITLRDLYLTRLNPEVSLKSTEPDNFALVRYQGDVIPVKITSVSDSGIDGFMLHYIRNIYSTPYPSKELYIGTFRLTEKCVRSAEFVKKCVSFKIENEFYIIPFVSSVAYC